MKFKTEKDSIDYIISCLLSSGYTGVNSTQSDDQYCTYDITATNPINGKHIIFELKNRDCDSTTYGDNMIDDNKYNRLRGKVDSGEFDDANIINMFNDCWSSSNISSLNHKFTRYSPDSTYFKNKGNKSVRVLCSFNRDRKFEYER